jgi:hypothetical protein
MVLSLTIVLSVIFTAVTVVLSIGGLLLFRRLLRPISLKDHHDVADPYSQFVGMLFAVLLGFMVADAMQRFGNARSIVEEEASNLGNIYRLADAFPDAQRNKIQKLCVNYAELVINKEWPLLASKKTSRETWLTYRQLWKTCTSYEPTNQLESAALGELLSGMSTVGEKRRLRADSLHTGLPLVLWCILIIGGLATVVFTYFFNIDNLPLQIVMVAIVSLVICLNIFLLACYDDPFSGDVMITPEAFETQLELFRLDKNPAGLKESI